MATKPIHLTRAVALLLATAAAGPIAAERLLAQSPAPPPSPAPVAAQLPAGTVLRIDGSSSMLLTNKDQRDRFLKRFPSASVELGSSRTYEAIQALINGDLDIVAAGRPLTAAERSQGLVEVPIQREKIAIVIGSQNPFDGTLSFEQFAHMFRGEITNWDEVGGPAKPIRIVDRPDFSDTRLALSRYTVFADDSFRIGATADPVAEDDTEAVVEALGDDGIGYAVVSQVQGRRDVRILAMHKTLPNDPRYPYSQPRAYVYNAQTPTPAALAFIALLKQKPDPAASTASPTASPSTASPSTASSSTAAEISQATPTPAPASPDGNSAGLTPAADGAAKSPPARQFPWWLLGIPLLGGLLWWLLKEDPKTPIAAPVPPPAAADLPSRIILTPRHCRLAYAYWEVADQALSEARAWGGRDLVLRLFEVGDGQDMPEPTQNADPARPGEAERHLPDSLEQYAVSEEQCDLHLPIPLDDRDYQVELGYVTDDNRWLSLAKSAPVRVPPCPGPGEAAQNSSGAAIETVPVAQYDVSAVGFQPPPARSRPAYGVEEADGDREDLGNLSEVGDETADGPWPSLARSAPISMPAGAVSVAPQPAATAPSGTCAIETLAVHSRRNAVSLGGSQMQYLQDQVGANYSLDPGFYILRVKSGAFNYGDNTHPGEPWVLLWIYGGQVSNLKTGVWVNGTWSTLNGYADTLSLEVDEPAQLCAFFIDTFPENNANAVTLSVIRL